MIQAIIFDMDGLLIDSEPLWQEAEKNIFSTVGVYLNDEQVTYTTGLRVDEVVEYWFQRSPWDERVKTKLLIEQEIIAEVIRLIDQKGVAKPGVSQILDFLYTKDLPIAIASSSAYVIINAVVERLGINKYFKLIYSAEEEKYGKPHPGVYISTCEKLGVQAENTITFEDSFNGILSAKSARIKCIAVPEDINKGNPKFVIADMILESLEDFGEEEWNELSK